MGEPHLKIYTMVHPSPYIQFCAKIVSGNLSLRGEERHTEDEDVVDARPRPYKQIDPHNEGEEGRNEKNRIDEQQGVPSRDRLASICLEAWTVSPKRCCTDDTRGTHSDKVPRPERGPPVRAPYPFGRC